MVTKGQKVRVVVLISLVISITLYILFILIGNKLFSQKDIYYIKFKKQSVTGLNIGQDVRYYGINIGKVTDIYFNDKNISEIIIRIDVKENTPIKNTVKANLNFIGITGLKQIELIGGENKDKNLLPGSYIDANKSIMDDISGKAEIISEKIERVLNNAINITNDKNREEFSKLLLHLNKISVRSDSILNFLDITIRKNRVNLENLVLDSDKLILSLTKSSDNINLLVSDARTLINSPILLNILNNSDSLIAKLNDENIPNIIENFNNLLKKSRDVVIHFDKTILASRKNFLKSINLLKEVLENINEFAMMLRDNPDMLIKGKNNEF